jgi:hypothetical protein
LYAQEAFKSATGEEMKDVVDRAAKVGVEEKYLRCGSAGLSNLNVQYDSVPVL